MTPLWFRAFGLRISSDIDLAGVPCRPGLADLTLESRPLVPGAGPRGPLFWGKGEQVGESVAAIPGLARFRARQGKHVLIETAEELSELDRRAIAISTALPLALQQRAGLLLESSAFRWEGKVYLVVGRGPCGKSSLAALMADAGAQLLADSHCMIRMSADGTLEIHPALPHVRLWPGQIAELTGTWPEPERVRKDLDKQMLTVPERYLIKSGTVDGLLRLRRGVDSGFQLRRLSLAEALQGLALSSDRLRTGSAAMQKGGAFSILTALAGLPVCHLLQWARGTERVAVTRDRLVEFLGKQNRAPSA